MMKSMVNRMPFQECIHVKPEASGLRSLIFDDLADPEIIVNDTGSVCLANSRTTELTAIARADIENMVLMDLSPSADLSLFFPADTVPEKKQALVLLKTDGTEFPCTVDVLPFTHQDILYVKLVIHDKENDLEKTRMAGHNLSGGKIRGEEQKAWCRDIESKLRSLFHMPTVGIGIANAARQWTEFNPALASMLGYSEAELASMTWDKLIPEGRQQATMETYNQFAQGTRDTIMGEQCLLRKDGSLLWALTTTHGTHNEQGSGLGLMICKDFVERNAGEITVTSAPGRGSWFMFTIPVGAAAPV